MHFNFHLSVARMDTMASVASSMGQTVRTAIIPNVAQSIMEVITAKIGTSIASIVLDRVHAIHDTQTRILNIENYKLINELKSNSKSKSYKPKNNRNRSIVIEIETVNQNQNGHSTYKHTFTYICL